MQETELHVPNYIFAMSLKPGKCSELKGDECLSIFVKTFIGKKLQDYTFTVYNPKGYDAYVIVR